MEIIYAFQLCCSKQNTERTIKNKSSQTKCWELLEAEFYLLPYPLLILWTLTAKIYSPKGKIIKQKQIKPFPFLGGRAASTVKSFNSNSLYVTERFSFSNTVLLMLQSSGGFLMRPSSQWSQEVTLKLLTTACSAKGTLFPFLDDFPLHPHLRSLLH